ncbi:MAG TPA: hypothetical protein VHR66_13495 [Gemmataceae bacterium]|jgi:hypothetical protein|nr:hypothetical protein [Gemmataceae bacterium]
MPRRDYDDDYDDDDRPSRSSAKFPPGVKAAGIIWISFGALGLINIVLQLAMAAGNAVAGGGPGGSPYTGVGCGVIIALVFLMVGIQTVKGTAKGVLGNGIGSIIFGVLYLSCGGLLLAGSGFVPAGADSTLLLAVGGIALLMGLALLLAGVLALMGKSAYEEWRVAAGLARKPRRRTQEERDYDDDRPRKRRDADDDDRPKRRDADDDDDRPKRRPRRDDDE